ncbi:hypothetical protein Cgig2_022143 [Carnegiea gigantea]|uniref:Uncharacterized protein n=1 Tax=Carnegiea gigantea TaxID=171969 RepID=A0A9Q1QAV2_9CARY|nr:hypothetical protein Cgig2_022143 [Carnegiea gigantea]
MGRDKQKRLHHDITGSTKSNFLAYNLFFTESVLFLQSSASDSHNIYLSISTPILSTRTIVSKGLRPCTIQKVKDICPGVVNIVEPAREGYQLTLRLNIAQIPQGKDGTKVIKEIAAIESVILSSQLKEMLRNFRPEDASQGTCKPVKFTYHPREPIFVIRQVMKSHRLTA